MCTRDIIYLLQEVHDYLFSFFISFRMHFASTFAPLLAVPLSSAQYDHPPFP